ncbi:MAG: peptide chain release factor 2 [Lachnospiraceae bacterium]|nr:peptide chain release factor 2 [Lachnospiraceae bacterium]MBS4937473.1 peptide chain release factor 2 [Lachnospiraceae bacterium]RKW33488.1 MAG: peptide chain release factor 2 [Lachnoanaerobaculum sp.]
MVELDQFKYKLSSYESTLLEVRDSLDLDSKERRIVELDRAMEEPDFWDNPEQSTKLVKEAKSLKDTVEAYRHLESEYEDIGTLIEMGYEENDESLIPEIEQMLNEFVDGVEQMKVQTLLSGPYDRNNAILKLGAGAGGTESCDWCEMLYRMYTRWAQNKGYSLEVLDYLDGDEAGIKSITMKVEGENAYGYLRSEHGVHRLVRISPFNTAGKRQTSFVSCDIMPEMDEDLEVEINPEDLRVDTYRSSGAGGQHINKTSSAVRITHIPTGVVVQCQSQRSQFQNKEVAMQMLKAKLFMLKQQAHVDKLSDIRGDVKDVAWGSQIRSYILQPYTMVKDHRTGCESGNAQAVLDGDIDKFIIAYLTWDSLGRPDGSQQDMGDIE